VPGGELCEDCAATAAAETARHGAQERRAAAKAERARRLQELAEAGCGCISEAECRLWATDWAALPKSKARKAWQELHAACARAQRVNAEEEQRRAERERQRNEEQRQQRQALEQHWADLRAITLIEPIASLAAMRTAVLAERHDRCPKWRFKLAVDLVVQIQPRPAERRDKLFLFECTALRGVGIEREHFASAKARQGTGLQAVTFGILLEDGRWRLAVTGCTGLAGLGAELYARRLELVALVVEHLPRLAALNADQMFEPACLCCGKALTDPASMARFIGPECAGTSSLDAGLLALRAA
jgi:hypothetical protein